MNQRIVFMGTPGFAVGTLDALLDAGLDVAAVVTAPDKPAGRGRQLRASAVKERALERGLHLLQPERLKDPAFHAELDRIDAALYIVVAFRMLPEAVWARPPLGTVNLHASLLPDYRGAAPINWAIINGERRTGVTTFRIQHEIDTGDILLRDDTAIGANETAGELHDRLMAIGAKLMVRTVKGLFEDSLEATPQQPEPGQVLHAAPKIGPETTRITIDSPAERVHDLVRGMSPFPGAWCTWEEEGRLPVHFKLLRTEPASHAVEGGPGTVKFSGGRMYFACGDGTLEALEVQPEGKRRMTASEFIRGLRPAPAVHLR